MESDAIILQDIAVREGMSMPIRSTLVELIRAMDQNHKGVVAVLDGERPVGILTERDVARLLASGVSLDAPGDRHVRKPLVVVEGKRTIGYALDLLTENNLRKLMVVDGSGEFRGVVTQNDLMRYLEEDYYRSTLKVKHLFSQFRPLVSASKGETVMSVLEKMVDGNISAVPILEDGVPAGILTEKDILRLANRAVPLTEPAWKYMSSPVVCAGLDTNLVDIVKMINAKGISRVLITDPGGLPVGMITGRDLVRNLEGNYNEFLERKLRQSKRFLSLLPEMLVELIDTGEAQLIVWANDKALGRFGREILDKPAASLLPQEEWELIHGILIQRFKIDAFRFQKGNKVYECSGFYLPLERPTERGRVQLILRDVTEEVLLATTDPLTGIYNRRFLTEFLAKETERSLRMKKRYAVILADLDHFKGVNDSYGHLYGDEVLRTVTKIMGGIVREYDFLGRWGGEEFLVILPEIPDRQAAEGIAERMRQAIEASPIVLPGEDRIRMTASFGLAVYGEDGITPDVLIRSADERMYEAKRRGRNRVVSR